MNTYYRIKDGKSVDESEALLDGVLRSGYGLRTPLQFKDGGQERTIPAGYVLDGSMVIADSQDEYERRISSAWMGNDARPAARKPHLAPYRHAPVSEAQEAYQRRISEAWRAA